MALSTSQQLTRWGLIALVFLGLLWVLRGVLTPYLVAMALAYFLDPIADRLEKMGLSRLVSVMIITLSAVILIVIFVAAVAPLIVRELAQLISAIPELSSTIESIIRSRFPEFALDASEIFTRFQEGLQSIGAFLSSTLLNSVRTIFGFLALVVIVPVVTFFILLDWDSMVAQIDSWLPRDHRSEIRKIFRDIDQSLASFIRGQGTVCMIMACYYAMILGLLGVNYGIAIGFVAGMLTFIPYVGAAIGGLLVVGVSLFQAWTGISAPAECLELVNEVCNQVGEKSWFGASWAWFGLVLALYFGGQSVEGNVITPNLVGKSIGLHPVWLMFSLSVFGSLMGLTGMLIAVPLAAVIGVLGRHFFARYQSGKLYLGQEYLSPKSGEDE